MGIDDHSLFSCGHPAASARASQIEAHPFFFLIEVAILREKEGNVFRRWKDIGRRDVSLFSFEETIT